MKYTFNNHTPGHIVVTDTNVVDGKPVAKDVVMVKGEVYELPEDNDHVRCMVALKQLTPYVAKATVVDGGGSAALTMTNGADSSTETNGANATTADTGTEAGNKKK